MEKEGNRKRDIRFFSAKNSDMITVHSYEAKKYADKLESDEGVKSYKANVELEGFQDKISLAGIRKLYRACAWTTDFLIEKVDGGVAVREGVGADALEKRSELEKLELSRRYWAVAHVEDWAIVQIDIERLEW